MIVAMSQTPGTIQTMETSNMIVVDLPQATPSVAGSAGGVPIPYTTELQVQNTQMAPAALPQMIVKCLNGDFHPTSLGFRDPGLPYRSFFCQRTRRALYLLVASSSGSLDVKLVVWLQAQSVVLRA